MPLPSISPFEASLPEGRLGQWVYLQGGGAGPLLGATKGLSEVSLLRGILFQKVKAFTAKGEGTVAAAA